MILKELKLRNFKSHKDTTVTFANGTTIILGENGAGKSTILEAINYALYKKAPTNQNNLIMHNTTSMGVELTFNEKGTDYKVSRTRDKSKSSSYLSKLEDGVWVKYLQGNKEVDNEITSILNMDMELFLNSVYIRQGEMTSLVSKNPSERKRLLARLLRIDDLEKSWKAIPQVISRYENKKSLLGEAVSQRKGMERDIILQKEELIRLKGEYTSLVEEENRLLKEKETVSVGKREFGEKKTAYDRLQAELKHLEELERYKSQYEERLDGLSGIEKQTQRLLKSLMGKNEEALSLSLKRLESENIYLKGTLDSSRDMVKEICGLDDKCPLCQSDITSAQKEELIDGYEKTILSCSQKISANEDMIRNLSKELKSIKRNNDELARLQAKSGQKKDYETHIGQLSRSIKDKMEIVDGLRSQSEGYDNDDYVRLDKLEREVELKIRENTRDIGIIKGKTSKVTQHIKELEDKVKEIGDVEDEIKNIDRYINILKGVREVYGKDGLQGTLRRTVNPIIQQNTNIFFEKFNFQYTGLEISDEFDIALDKNGEKLEIGMISGGEQIAVALALRLGMAQAISTTAMDSIILDEPTVHLDDGRVQELGKMLQGASVVPQMLVVTHEPGLENCADETITIAKSNGISYVVEER